MTSRADLIAESVLGTFEKLPAKRQPTIRDNGLHEWVPLSGIVAERDGQFECLALATGMKCLPSSKLPSSDGVGIHDWHAEILAIRAFNRFLLDECQRTLHDATVSRIVRKHDHHGGNSTPFQVRDDVRLHMYCSEAPCGDASMELTMTAQKDASPWNIPPTGKKFEALGQLPGRAYFSQLGVVRRKPARGDAPPTLSKSCSDKLALRQCTSLLSSLTSLFIDPANAYLDTVVLPQSQYAAEACKRAFSRTGRMKAMSDREPRGAFNFTPFSIETTELEFRCSKRAVQARSVNISASNLAAAWSASGIEESIIGGIIQGRKPSDPKAASSVSRRRMWVAARELADSLHEAIDIQDQLNASTYGEVKRNSLLAERRQMKADVYDMALVGWVKNGGDSDFGIDDTVHGKC